MTPFGHISTGFIFEEKIFTAANLNIFILGSIFPDFDFIFYYLDNFNTLHRTFSHSLFFIVIISLMIYLLASAKNRKIYAISFFVGAILHILIDASLDSNPSNGMGVMIFWPISHDYIYLLSPLGLETDLGSWKNGVAFMKNNFVYILMIELPFWLYALVLYKKRKNNG